MPSRFVAAATSVEQLPDHDLPEFGFIGRSNVGKSSLVGMLLGDAKLVRTSRSPGQTRTLNLFFKDNEWALVDLPGYGYARVSKSERDELGRMIRDYVERRGSLVGVVQILDARRSEPSDLDRVVQENVQRVERALLVVVTKLDLIPKTKRLGAVRAIERSLGIPQGAAVACSSKTGEGRKELVRALLDRIGA